MAYQVVWSTEALKDVETIANFIARDSPAYASAVVDRILKVTRGLEIFPLSGRIVPEFGDFSIRETIIHSYRIIYRIQDETVVIATVIHGKRLLE